MTLSLQKPSRAYLPSYIEALREGSFNPMQLSFGVAEPEEIERDPDSYLTKITTCPPFTLSLEGKNYEVTEHELLWIVDAHRFLGTIALRYKAAAVIINEWAGHIGMAIRPGLLNRGYGPRAILKLGQDILQRFHAHGLTEIYASCDPHNRASAHMIEHFGGKLIRETDNVLGRGPGRLYKISL